MSLHESFLTHARSRWLKLALLLCAVAIGLYIYHDPNAGPNGGTALGYGLGGLGFALILWLALLGARKRSYGSRLGTVKGWTSAHVWLGLALVVIGTLHTGFQFGLNVHTLAWTLMMLVIISGLWGVFAYQRYPTIITDRRGSLPAEDMLREIAELDRQLVLVASELGKDVHDRTLQSIARTRLGGSFWQQVRGIPAQSGGDSLVTRLREELNKPVIAGKPEMAAAAPTRDGNATMMFVADAFVSGRQGADQRETRRKLLDLFSRKKALVGNLNADVTRRARLALWLYFHVPLTIALIASLLVHVLAVFIYW